MDSVDSNIYSILNMIHRYLYINTIHRYIDTIHRYLYPIMVDINYPHPAPCASGVAKMVTV